MNTQQQLLENILRLCRVMHRKPSGQPRISHGGYRVTNAIMENEGIRVLDLAELLGIRPSSLTGSLKKLEEQGYIYREKDERDSRAYHLYSTERTRREHSKWKKEQSAQVDSLKVLTDEEAETFMRLCDKICTHLEKLSDRR